MSGKPASVAASRAGVASVAGVAGAPRVLLYVAERQLEHAVAGPDVPPASAPFDALFDIPNQIPLPRSVYRSDQNDHRNPPGVIYKSFNDDAKCTFEENVTQRSEFFNVPSQFLKEPLKEDKAVERQVSVKREFPNSIATEYSVETFQGRIPDGEIATYQRCSINTDNMPSMLPIALRHTQNQFESAVQESEGTNSGEREISMSKGYVNYQFLEQSATHQSIVNQSINILNQQVGVNRTIVGEGESGGGPQLVRTPEGVVLAVLPSSANSGETEHRTAQSEFPQTITVPLGWRRIVNGSSVMYFSPSGTVLSALSQLREYLQTAGTCKCGLPCPLRPETAFSFDPKVVSKQYQPASGAELTKLCNHKRKLLATLQARAQSPATPPPLQPPHPPHNMEQKKGAEVGGKKKMKKRASYISNINISPLLVQKDKPSGDFKNQDIERKRTVSPGTMVQRGGMQQCPPGYSMQQNMLNVVGQESDFKQETLIQRSLHYLTVNNGWITQQADNGEAQKQNQSSQNSINNSMNVGLPVLGTNGQIIGVNTGFNKQTTNPKNVISIPSHNMIEQDHKVVKKDMYSHMHQIRQQNKDDDSQSFCGLNQALTPEVMQKINEQQQIFIQQNQKQIEMAMKGFKPQLSDNGNNKQHTQYVPQSQLVIQNGAVVKTNSAKTPPWQVKRNDPNASMTSPSPKSQKIENLDYEEQNPNVVDESSKTYNSFPGQDNMTPPMCPRVPPLPQHYNMMSQQWPGVELTKKKAKGNNKAPKKKFTAAENKTMYGNNGVRYVQDSKGKCEEVPMNNVPSFMDDPNGYLAQQTVLLNNTISKQVGISSSYDSNQYETSTSSYSSHGQNDKHGKPVNKSCEMINIFKNNMVPNSSPSPNNTPDSSLVPEKAAENTLSHCCKGCNNPYKGTCTDYTENHIRAKYIKHNMSTIELDGNPSTSSPKHGFDDNPVSSSTFIERNLIINEHSGPIQAGVVSTSNVSPTETLQPPEPSPTLSNSSRSTDTPHSGGSNAQMQNNCPFPIPSPAYPGSCRDNANSNPSTPSNNNVFPYNSPGPPSGNSALGTQMMHFISNHNVNKNLMEVDNISMVGVKPSLRTQQELYRLEARKRLENTMPGYCPPPHLGGGPAHSLIQACYVQTFVTTMASGFSVTRDTVTSVLAGKANTATTSINASQANFIRPPPPPSVNLATTYAIPTNQPDPFINSVNLPTSYPLHIAGTTAQNMISKTPLEMVQNVISSQPSKSEVNNTQSTPLTQMGRRSAPTTPGHILISSTGQIIVSNNHMPPPPPKTTTVVSSIQASSGITNVTSSVTQVVPAVGNVQPIVNQSTVVVNTLPAPFVLQPPMMAVDGQVMQPNAVIPQIVTGGIVSGQTTDTHRQIEVKNGQSFVHGMAMLSPETLKKRSKKKKTQAANITNVLQITAPQQNPSNIMVHSSPQHNSSPQFSPRGFQLSPTNNISPTPMLQALTIVPGKSGTPAHIVMNGQGNTNNFGSQQILANTSPSQQINLLQPVNLINNTTSVMSNFPAFQQFIVPNLGGMVMTADGTAIIQDNSTGMPMQLQLQTVNGQNVLTPVQNTGVFAGGNSGVVIRAQNQQGKLIQSQHSPGAQFLSPNSQVMMSSPNFNGQLSPLLANLSPTNVTFNTSPHQVRTGNVQTQEFIQTNQMGQTLMVPLSPNKQPSLVSASNNRSNSTFVQQNTTIVQQQTTLVSNAHNAQMSCQANLHGGNSSRLSIDPSLLLTHKQITNQKGRSFVQIGTDNNHVEEIKEDKHTASAFGHLASNEPEGKMDNEGYARFMNEFNPLLGQGTFNSHVRHSVSTQTLVNQQRGKSPNNQAVSGSSPPDTTTHSPLGALETASSPRVYGARCMSTQGNYADTTTKSPEPADINSSGMVQCVSSSEQDIAESRERAWPAPRSDITSDAENTHMISNVPMLRQSRSHPVETSELHYSQSMATAHNHQHVMPMTSNYYDRQSYKRKNEFGDGSSYRTDKIMRTNYSMVHGMPTKDTEYDGLIHSPEKSQRHFPSSGSSSAAMQKVFDRHNLGSGDDSKSGDESDGKGGEGSERARKFGVGDLVWGPVKGYNSWPGKLESRSADGKWSVRWFGADKTVGCVEDSRLLTLSEGLEAHHAARTKHRKSRKLNALLENAIQEAMAELDKKCDKSRDRRVNDSDIGASIMDTPKRSKKHDKPRNKERHRKAPARVDSTRLRSSR